MDCTKVPITSDVLGQFPQLGGPWTLHKTQQNAKKSSLRRRALHNSFQNFPKISVVLSPSVWRLGVHSSAERLCGVVLVTSRHDAGAVAGQTLGDGSALDGCDRAMREADMSEGNDQPRKMSRQERRHAEQHAPTSTPEARQAVSDYRDLVIGLSRQLRERMDRAKELLVQIDDRIDEETWRSETIALCRSWRQALDAMPDEAPPMARQVHARVLRWFSAAADAGEDYAAGVEERDTERLLLAARKMDTVTALTQEASKAAKALAARTQS